MPTKKPAVTWSVENGVAVVTMARAHANAINDDLVEGLITAFHDAEDDPDVRGVLLRAEGKLFCPGLDLRELIVLDRPEMEGFMERFGACVLVLYGFRKPFIAALQAHALAGGFVLAMTADWRILRRGSMVGLNEVKVGVPLPYGVAHIVRETIPKSRETEVALLGRNYRDDEALAAGLVHEVVDADAFEDACRARLDEFVTKDTQAFALTKRYLRSATIERIRATADLLVPEFLDAWFSAPTRARIEEIVAGLEKRPS